MHEGTIMNKSWMAVLALVSSWTGASASALAAATQPKVTHAINQSLLYLEAGAPGKAAETLERIVAEEPGKSDALPWLLLGRAYVEMNLLDKAGAAVTRSVDLGIDQRTSEAAWAGSFLGRFREQFGALQIVDAPPARRMISTPFELAGPVSSERRAALEAVPGWTQKKLERRVGTSIYLPAASFRLGPKVVEVVGGRTVKVTVDEVGGTCGTAATLSLAGAPAPASYEWVWWAAGGTAAAAGLTAIILIATAQTKYKISFPNSSP